MSTVRAVMRLLLFRIIIVRKKCSPSISEQWLSSQWAKKKTSFKILILHDILLRIAWKLLQIDHQPGRIWTAKRLASNKKKHNLNLGIEQQELWPSEERLLIKKFITTYIGNKFRRVPKLYKNQPFSLNTVQYRRLVDENRCHYSLIPMVNKSESNL